MYLPSLDRRILELAHKSFGTTASLPGSQTVLTTVESCHVLVRTDNMTVVSYLNRQERLYSHPLYGLARSVLLWD